MKRKLVAFLLSACLLFPASLMFTACALFDKSSKDPETETGTGNGTGNGSGNGGTSTPATPTAAEIYAEALDNLDAILENATISIIPQLTYTYYDGYDDPVRVEKDLGYEIEYKTSDGDFSMNLQDGAVKGYRIDNVMYSYSDSEWIIEENIGEQYGYTLQMPNFVNQELILKTPTIINSFTSVAKYFDTNAISVVDGANSTKILKVSLDLKDQLNNLIENYLTNKNEPIGVFVNTLLSDITGSEVDVLDIVDEFTDEMTDETTFETLVDYVANVLGTTKENAINFIEKYLTLTSKISTEYNSFDSYNDGNGNHIGLGYITPPMEFEIDESMLEMPIIPTLEALINENAEPGQEVNLTGTKLKMYVEEYFISDEAEITDLIEVIISAQEIEDDYGDVDEEATLEYQELIRTYISMVESMLEYTTVQNAKLAVQFTLDANNNPTAIKLIAEGNAKVDDGENLSTGSAYATIDAIISRVGTTTIAPVVSNPEFIRVHIGLSGEQFMQNSVTVQLTSKVTPDDCELEYNNITLATFDADTKTLTLNMQNIRSLMEEDDNAFRFFGNEIIEFTVSTYDEI